MFINILTSNGLAIYDIRWCGRSNSPWQIGRCDETCRRSVELSKQLAINPNTVGAGL